MDKIAVSENAEFTKLYAAQDGSTIVITLQRRETVSIAIPEDIPAGSRKLSKDDVKRKAMLLMTSRIGAKAAGAVIDFVGGLNEVSEISGLLGPFIDSGDGSE